MTNQEFFERDPPDRRCQSGTFIRKMELTQIDGWDSLATMQVIAMVDDRLHHVIDAAAISRYRTLGQFAELAGASH